MHIPDNSSVQECAINTQTATLTPIKHLEKTSAPVGIRIRVPSSTGLDDRPLHYRGSLTILCAKG